MSNNQNQFVLPGDTIVTGDYTPEQNVIIDGDRVIATTVGFSEIKDSNVGVISLTGFYIPKIDDLIIGKVISYSALSWEIDINSYYSAILPASDIFGRDFTSSRDNLSLKLDKGDLIAARIVNVGSTREPLITISGQDLGKIDSGELVKITPSKVPRLIGKQGSMIQAIEGATNSSITIGQNGWIIVSNDETNGLLKAIEAIRLVDEQAHVANLTDKVNKMFEFKGVK
jgi:exosome complex component RRP4